MLALMRQQVKSASVSRAIPLPRTTAVGVGDYTENGASCDPRVVVHKDAGGAKSIFR